MNVTDEITRLTEELVEFRSTADRPGEIEKALNYIEDYFSGDEFVVQRYESGGKPTLVISFDETKEPDVMLHGHIDVVEAPEEMFETEIRDGKIHGRGTADMKAGVACLMKLMKDFSELEPKPHVALVIVSDEEIGGFDGMGYLIEEGFRPGFGISAEPNNLDGYMDIVIQQKGILQVTVSAEGKSAHGSKPWNGENAIEKLMSDYREIKSLFTSGDWNTTLNLGTFNGGDATNKVPGRAEMNLDIRFSPEYPSDEVIADFDELGVDYQVNFNEAMLENNPENPEIQALKETAEDIIGECELARKEPGSDMRFLAAEDIPAVVFGPEGYYSHGDDEHAVISSFEDYYKILKQFVESKR